MVAGLEQQVRVGFRSMLAMAGTRVLLGRLRQEVGGETRLGRGVSAECGQLHRSE